MPANSILLNPVDHDLLGGTSCGACPSARRARPDKRVRIDCDGSAFGFEDEVAEAVSREQPATQPMIIPVGPSREDDPTAAGR